MSDKERIPVSVIVGMRNSASTIIRCLEGLVAQDYPIAEILVFDNVSKDNSVALVEDYIKRCPVPLKLVKKTVDGGLSSSYNAGAELAVSPLLVLVHSDGGFPSTQELGKLVAPLLNDPDCVAAYPLLLMPHDVWDKFPYWQKFLFARAVDREVPSMCGKFDCVRKDAFSQIGGFDTRRFTATCGYGGEDSDFNYRISKVGKVVGTDARVIHLHDLSQSYGLKSLFATRKLMTRTYAKILRFQRMAAFPGAFLFFVKPVFAVLPLVPHFFLQGLLAQLVLSVVVSWKMYTSRQTLLGPRILLVPIVDIALIYFETAWFIEGLISAPADASASRSDDA